MLLSLEDNLFYQFDYRRLSNNPNTPLAPVVEVRLKNRREFWATLVNKLALIDTGADATLVPMSIIAQLRLEPIGRVKSNNSSLFLKGFGKVIIADTTYSLFLSFGDNNYFRIIVWGLLVEESLVIIGRDLLNTGFNVNFDGKNFKTTIQYNPDS